MKDIIIVGGGSAGWMTAAILIKSFPDKKITLIEDPETPPIGVGESTFDGIRYYCEFIGIEEKSFFKHTNASIKIGLAFKNFYSKEENDYFIYPFGPPYLTDTRWGLEDWLIKKSIYRDTPITDFAESYFPQALLVKHNRFSDNENGKLGEFIPKLHTALHFDAFKFGDWLKTNYCIPRGVNFISAKVFDISVHGENILNLQLDNGDILTADLYIDCTGFKSLLLDKSIKEPFIDYTDLLPNNKAWATQIEYKDKEKELKTVTTCTAIENGWCWDIPLWSRLGSGYVYSDKYVSDEDALIEFKKYLQSDKMTISRTEKEVESYKYKNISMRVGIHERTWVGNVVAIGLSAGFIEPLESNGLFTVHEFLFQLVRALDRGFISQWSRDVYNTTTKETFDGFVDFIRLHYLLTSRNDTKYWENNLNKSTNFIDIEKSNWSNRLEQIRLNKVRDFIAPTNGGTTWISAGMNYPLLDKVSIRLGEIKNLMNYGVELNNDFYNLKQKQLYWEKESLNSPSLYNYLKKKYYE